MYLSNSIRKILPFYFLAYVAALIAMGYSAYSHTLPMDRLADLYPAGRSYPSDNFRFLDVMRYPNVAPKKTLQVVRYTTDKVILRTDGDKETETSPTAFLANVAANQPFRMMDKLDSALVPLMELTVGMTAGASDGINAAAGTTSTSLGGLLLLLAAMIGGAVLLLLICGFADKRSRRANGGSLIVSGGIMASAVAILLGILVSNENALCFLLHLPASLSLYPWYAILAYAVVFLPLPCLIAAAAIDTVLALVQRDILLFVIYPVAAVATLVVTPIALYSVLLAVVMALMVPVAIVIMGAGAGDSPGGGREVAGARSALSWAETELDEALKPRDTDFDGDWERRVERANYDVARAEERLRDAERKG